MRRHVAVVVSLSVLLSACGLIGGGDSPSLVAYFSDVGDLVPDAQVQVNDVEIGRVTEIELVYRDGKMLARVAMSLDKDARVPAEDLQAIVRQTSLLGEQFVQLVPVATEAPFVGEVDVTIPLDQTERRVDVETVLSDLAGFVGEGGLEDLNRFTHAQALILEDRGRRFGEVLEELETFTSILARRKLDVGAAIDSLASGTGTLARNKATLDDFLDSLDEANALLAEQGSGVRALLASLRRFGTVSARFLGRHEQAINRQFRALRPILRGLAGAENDLRVDIVQLATFLDLFEKSMGGGRGGGGSGDYIQIEAVLCEALEACHATGQKGDVPGEGS